ncbi:MAG: hypothetical protein JXD21_06915 [Candidatus Omnitrophica bacterium]|nr:hypothetical protein [Candidatus Omnitrophota bacterium]
MCKEFFENRRAWGGVVYIIVGLILVTLPLVILFFEKNNLPSVPITWCLGLSSIGVGAGLIDTRNHSDHQQRGFHLLFYCGFVWIVVSLLSLIVALRFSEVISLPNLSFEVPSVKFYSSSALIGLVGGLLGNSLRSTLESLLKNKKRDG